MVYLLVVTLVLAFMFGFYYLEMLAWNYVAVHIFPGLPELTYWQVVICSFLLWVIGSYFRPWRLSDS